MYLLNLSLGQFLLLFGAVSTLMVALYLLDRSRRRQVVSSLKFWIAAEQPAAVSRRKRIQQPLSLILQLLSMALLLLAIAQLRIGARESAPQDHVLILDTSAWMAAHTASGTGGQARRTLMDLARARARAYLRAVPSRDRIMLVRADALTTPATAFEPDREKLERAIDESRPGATALNLDQAMAFARQLDSHGGPNPVDIVFVGTGRITAREPAWRNEPLPRNFRFVPVSDSIENCGLRKIGVRRSASDPSLWDVYVSVRNYGSSPAAVALSVGFGPQAGDSAAAPAMPVGSKRLTLPAGAEKEATFEFRTRASGILEARLTPTDAFPEDDRAVVEIPDEPAIHVAVYTRQPDLLRPFLMANPRLTADFYRPAEYRPDGNGAALVILDRFRPTERPGVDSIWIDPPVDGSPIPIRDKAADVPFARWFSDNPLGAGLRMRDFQLQETSVFETAPDDIRVGEVAEGPVIVARPGKPKIVELGFHPALSAMRYELTTPLLFANILRWMEPQSFRRWETTAGSVGTVKVELDPDVEPSDVRVQHDDGTPVPFTARQHSLHFFVGTPGTVRVLASDREYVYSLTLPQVGEARWAPPASVHRGIPRFRETVIGYAELWQWLAVLGALGFIAEWMLFGRMSRGTIRSLGWKASGKGQKAKVA